MLTAAFFPVLCGSAFKNKGVQPLLDAVVDYLPSPLDVLPSRASIVKTGEEIVRKADDKEPMALLAFKIMDDPFVGTLTFCRIYSGTLSSGTGVLNSTRERKERVGRMHQQHAADALLALAGRIDDAACRSTACRNRCGRR